MPRDDSAYPDDWLRVAEKDLHRVGACLTAGDPELAGFCLQQAVEKFLKAYLLDKGWALRRIHDLEALLDEAIRYEPAWEKNRSGCQQITKFYTLSRYPLPIGEPPLEDDIRAAWQAIEPLIVNIRAALA